MECMEPIQLTVMMWCLDRAVSPVGDQYIEYCYSYSSYSVTYLHPTPTYCW